VVTNGIIAQYIMNWKLNRRIINNNIYLLIVTLFLVYGIYQYGTNKLSQPLISSNSIKVVIVQGNIPQEVKWDEKEDRKHFNKYIGLTKDILKQNPNLIVWPETAITDFLSENGDYRNQLVTLATTHRMNLLLGALDGKISKAERIFYNAVLLIEPAGKMNQKYYKTHLVPFGEYLPLESTFPALKNLNIVPSHFSPGKELTIFTLTMNSSTTKLSSLICFESIMPTIAREMVRRGAQCLVIVTNDSWFGKTSAPYQHADIAKFRAIENGIPIIRAANTGYSCFINSNGQILQGLDIYKTGTLVETLQIENKPKQTFYNKYGDWFPILTGIILIGFMAIRGKSII